MRKQQTRYPEFESVFLITDNSAGNNQFAKLLQVRSGCITGATSDSALAALFRCTESTLVTIDFNSIGPRKTDTIVFLLKCLFPYLNAVLIASDLSKKEQERYLASGVVAIIQDEGPASVVSAVALC